MVSGYPYYLWDIAGRQTVRTGDLGDFPAYTCISYTWGRWQVKGSFRGMFPRTQDSK